MADRKTRDEWERLARALGHDVDAMSEWERAAQAERYYRTLWGVPPDPKKKVLRFKERA